MAVHPCNEPLKPGPELRQTLIDVQEAFEGANIQCWLAFGALFGLVKNNGCIPDADFDFCCNYGADYSMLIAFMESKGYRSGKILLNDIDKSQALYCGFSRPGMPHVCVSFWYSNNGTLYYCHDQKDEVKGVGVPPSGYYFRGVPATLLESDMFRYVEWPGIEQDVKVRVPIFAGAVLDYFYPGWAYIRQRYTPSNGKVVEDKCVSIYRGHAVSPCMVHVDSMKRWHDRDYIKEELEKGKLVWQKRVKELREGQ